MKEKNNIAWVIFVIALLVLIGGWIYSVRLGDTLRYWDEEEYFIYIKNFLSTHIYTFDGINATALRPPGYPFILMLFGALGVGRIGLRMLNFVALAGSFIILYYWLKEHLDATAGLIAIGLSICYPVLFYAAGTFFPQTLGAAIFLLVLYFFTKKPLRIWQAAVAGLIFGYLVLTIPIFIFGALLICLWLILRDHAWRTAAVFIVMSGLVIGIWTLRNYRVFNTFVFVATDSGFNFLMGNAPETTPNSGLTIDFNKYKNETSGMDEIQADAYYRNRAIQFIQNDKSHAVSLYFSKLLNFFNFRNEMLTQGESSSLRDLVMLLGYGSLILILLIRIVSFRLFKFTSFEVFLLLFYFLSAFVYAVFFTRIRFRLPFDYLLIAFDAVFLRKCDPTVVTTLETLSGRSSLIRSVYLRIPVPLRLILLSLIFGLTYVFLIPPWQHYDEPGHFEYVWLIANRYGWPRAGDYDPALRREMLFSMEQHNFPRYLDTTIDPNAADPNIGYSQVGDLPVYYWLAALPLYFLKGSSITFQLYGSRLMSMIMYMNIIVITWGVISELTTSNNKLRWLIPLTIILLPGFTDMMTAVNSDVGAVMAFSLFLLVSIRALNRGLTISRTLSLIGATALCCLMKNNVWIALLLLPVVILFSWLRGRRQAMAWVVCLAVVGIGFGAAITWGDAAMWYRRTFQNTSTRVATSLAPLGEHAFRIDLSQQESSSSIMQPLTPRTVVDLRNSPVTYGGWIWADIQAPAQLQLICECGGELKTISTEIQADIEPKFYVLKATVPDDARHLSAGISVPKSQAIVKGDVYYDGLVLIKGEKQSPDQPIFENAIGDRGHWDELQFANLLRNPSAEQAGPSLRTWANKILMKVLPPFPAIFPSDIPTSLVDWKGAGWYYKGTVTVILRTFWAKFGWGNVPLLGSRPYRVLAVVTFLGAAGAVWAVWQRKATISWVIILVLSLGFLGIWIPVIIRGLGSMFDITFIPGARYGTPAIIITIMLLTVGWLQLLRLLGHWLRIGERIIITIYLLGFSALNLLAILSITNYYYAV